MTLRAKVVVFLMVLAALGLTAAVLVVSVQRNTLAASAESRRTAAVLDRHAELTIALLNLKTARRGYLLSGSAELKLQTDREAASYRAALDRLRAVVVDPEQSARLTALAAAVVNWQALWETTASVADGASPEEIVVLVERRFTPIQAYLDAFESRQQALADAAADSTSRSIGRATRLLLAIPLLAVVVLSGAAMTVRRVLADSRQLAERHREAREIAEQQRAELQTVLETVLAAILLVSSDGQRVLQNRAANALIGESSSEDALSQYQAEFKLLGRDGREIGVDRWPLMRALGGEFVRGDDVVVQSASGRTIPMIVSAAPMKRGDTVVGAVVAFQDVTTLKEVDRLKDEFVSIVSHELRTPLTSIRGSLQLVLDDRASVTDPDHLQLLQVALSNCERLIRIINDILDISKIEAGKNALYPRAVHLKDLVAIALDNVRAVANAAGIDVDVAVADTLPLVNADPDRMVQVLVNLFSNAIKFAPRSSRVVVSAAHLGAFVEVAVRDQGPGISHEHVRRLFQKFEQVDSSAARKKGGTGLGLAIVKGLVEQHGGTIRVESEPGQGACFTFTIPVALAGAATASAVARTPRVVAAPTILIVDDDDDFRLVLRKQLERAGFVVVEARDGVAGLQAARANPPALITVDLMMPGMNGWELLRTLAADPALRSIPVIVVSAVADRAGELASDVAVLAKPAAVDEVIQRIAGLIRSDPAVILVAEDDDDLRRILSRSLQKAGYHALEARDGAEALTVLDREHVDLVVLDLKMPNIDGFTVIERLRSGPRPIPVLVVSGSEGQGRSEFRAMQLGATDYMRKPIELAELARRIEQLITS